MKNGFHVLNGCKGIKRILKEGNEGVAKIGYCLESFPLGRTSPRFSSGVHVWWNLHVIADVSGKLIFSVGIM